ncbi:double-strand break repair protein AddB [Salaquimonas pukyongi]|uniref:double-strand break repair protein AddB n=1 Tax=Salaquimonas pukyongi TaxID=2712698 RepID=UPI00096B74F8|nr:double-strand break repair protein AddB [Salaquimonas pukyongi]
MGAAGGDSKKIPPGRVFTIPPSQPFLPTLARSILSGELSDSFDPLEHPLGLADSMIFLPTRRAARSFGVALLDAAREMAGHASIALPKIATLGDPDETEFLASLSPDAAEAGILLDSTEPVDMLQRKLVLARLTQHWVKSLQPALLERYGEEQIILPASAADALWLAEDLARLMDQVETEEVDWSAIRQLLPEEHAEWWQVTLAFLNIVMEAWPEHLGELGLVNPARHRANLADLRIRLLEESPPGGLVLAAGTTGSVPSTSRLLAAITRLPNGAVVLPGLDTGLPDDVVRQLQEGEEHGRESVASTHAQYGLCRLLKTLRIRHDQVKTLVVNRDMQTVREGVIHAALLPADNSSSWVESRTKQNEDELRKAFEGVAVLEAANERQEALAIALALREAVENTEHSAALVTPDRNLARRVSSELERFGIEIDDSAGLPLAGTGLARFVKVLIVSLGPNADPVARASLVKDRLLFGGEVQKAGELLELAALRFFRSAPKTGTWNERVVLARRQTGKSRYAPGQLRRLEAAQWENLSALASRIDTALKPLRDLLQDEAEMPVEHFCSALFEAAILCTANTQGESLAFDEAGGAELKTLLEAAAKKERSGFTLPPSQAAAVFEALIAPIRVRKPGRRHPRLHIYGTLEARLQHHDLMILGGLNEGTWPSSANNDPFLNRPMRSALSLPLPEQRIGLAAHDFSQLSGAPRIIYARAKRAGGSPAIASRWLQRLLTYLGDGQGKALTARGERYLAYARLIDATDGPPKPALRASYAPPVETRPKSLSITEIETWIRDPYAIHAKHILELHSLPPLVLPSDAAQRGTVYHDIVAAFIEQWEGPLGELQRNAALSCMAKLAEDRLEAEALPPEIAAGWKQRFGQIAAGFVDWEITRHHTLAESHCEKEVRTGTKIGKTGFCLRGRADRIDLHRDGSVTVIDYKTGPRPSNREARTLSPQLALEGALAARGAFNGVPSGNITALLHVRLREGNAFKIDDITSRQDLSAAALAEKAYDELADYIAAFARPDTPYVSQRAPVPNQAYPGDYDHLARIKEWSIGAEESGDGE